MSIEWPESLPAAPLLDGFSETLADTLIRSGMDQGPAKLRQRTTAGVAQINLGYILSTAQTQILAEFYAGDLAGGANRFDFPHPRTAETVTCRFRKPPEYAALNGGYYRARLELEVLP